MSSNRDDMLVKEARTQDLLKELTVRCPAMVFIAHVPDDAERYETRIVLSGSKGACVGLTALAQEIAMTRMMNQVKEDHDGFGEEWLD